MELSGKGRAELHIAALPLAGGSYTVQVYLLDESGLLEYDEATLDRGITVDAPAWSLAVAVADHRWDLGT